MNFFTWLKRLLPAFGPDPVHQRMVEIIGTAEKRHAEYRARQDQWKDVQAINRAARLTASRRKTRTLIDRPIAPQRVGHKRQGRLL